MRLTHAAAMTIAAITTSNTAIAQDTTPLMQIDGTALEASVFFPEVVSRPDSPQWDIAFTPDGRTLFYSTDAPRQIMTQRWLGDTWSEPVPALKMNGRIHGGVSVSPDGRFLYFSAEEQSGKRDLYRQNLTMPGAIPQRLTETPLYGEISVSLVANGHGFMWTDTKRDGSAGIGFYAVRIEGDTLAITADWSDLQTGDTSGENAPYMDPNGRFILFSNYDIAPGTAEDIFLSELRGGVPLPPVSLGSMVNTAATEGSPYITPDGQFLIFASDRGGNPGEAADYQLYVQPTAAIPVLNAVLQTETPTTALNLTPPAGPIVTSDQITVRDGIDYVGEDATPFTGTVEDRYPSGAMQRRKHLVNGRTQGVWIEWYETGVPSFYSEWNNGAGHGTWIYFHETGEISERVFAQDDKWTGVSEGWSAEGQQSYQAVFRDGFQTSVWRTPTPASD